MNIDWSKAPEWAVAHGLHETGFGIKEFWLGETQHQQLEHAKPFPYGGGDPSRDSFHNSRRSSFSYVTERPAAWSGEGLPPVWTVCEWLDPDSGRWLTSVIAFLSSWVIVVRDACPHPDGPVDIAFDLNKIHPKFRPIRTPEQIAADERKQQREQLADPIAGYMGFDDPREIDTKLAGYIVDHDYRKQVQP